MPDAPARHLAVVGPAPPYRGGIAHFTELTEQALSERGHRVSVVSFRRQYPRLLFPGTSQLEPEAAASADGSGAPRLLDPVNPVAWWRTARHLRRLAPDAVVWQYWMPFFAPAFGTVARALRRRGIASLAVVHNALPHERHLGDALLSRYFLRACAGHVVLSDAVLRDLASLRAPGAAVRRIEHPVYARFGPPADRAAARAALGVPPDAPVILFFGFVRAYKGLDVLLEALPRVAEAVPAVRLVVAGEAYDDPARYRRIIARHGLEARVTWHARYVASGEVPRYFAAADVVAQPYVRATQSGVAQVAFHFETPMVLTDVGGLAEVVPHEEAGLVVPPRDPQALAAALTRFFTEDLAARLTEGVRRQKNRFAPAHLAEAVEALAREAARDG
jgi:glycosyltransferase involved in cell wall biosynthesis